MAKGSVFVIGKGMGVVNLRDTDNNLKDNFTVDAGEIKNYELGDLEVELEDGNGNPLGNIDYLAYSTNQLDLTILAQCSVIIGTNTDVVVSPTPPPTPSEGAVWLLPI